MPSLGPICCLSGRKTSQHNKMYLHSCSMRWRLTADDHKLNNEALRVSRAGRRARKDTSSFDAHPELHCHARIRSQSRLRQFE